MPPRKISIADALSALKAHGLATSVTVQSEATPHPMDIPAVTKVSKAAKGYVKVTLFAKHTLSSSGQAEPGAKTVTGSGFVSYGPGVIDVPEAIAAQLLKQDQEARLGDERFRSTQQLSYLIVQRRNHNGYVAKVALPIPNEVLDSGLDLSKVSQLNEHNVRSM